jgi:hypothetical protein
METLLQDVRKAVLICRPKNRIGVDETWCDAPIASVPGNQF